MATTEISYYDRDAGKAAFGLELFQRVANNNPQSNILISPVSIGLLLSILYHGAKGATRDEIAAALGARDEAEIERSRNCWFDTLRQSGRDITIKFANSLWLQRGIALRPEYENIVMLRFEAWVEELDLHTEYAIRRINEWADRATYGRIPTFLTEIDPLTLQLAASAIWFKGNWAQSFNTRNTREQTFYEERGPTATPFMRQTECSQYAENEDFQAIGIPYEGQRFCMYVFLPKRNLADLIAQLSLANWVAWLSCFSRRPGTLELPRFMMRWSAVLNRGFREIGIREMFQPTADFSGMGQNSSCWIGEVTHKCFIDVNEEGTEAAAVTIARKVFGIEDPLPKVEPFHMIVNRPFLSVICDTFTGSILFIGAVNKIDS